MPLYLNAGDIERIAPPLSDVEQCVHELFRAQYEGKIAPNSRTAYGGKTTARFLAFPAIVEGMGIAGVKWLGMPKGGYRGPGGALSALLLISDAQTGALRGILNGEWITVHRTAVVSLIAARGLANASSRRIAFVGCGQQAAVHLDLFRQAFQLETVVASGRTSDTVDAFLERAKQHGLQAVRAASNQECVVDADIVISSVSAVSDERIRGANICADALKPGCFVSHVALGRPFAWPVPMEDRVVADDLDQYISLVGSGQLQLPEREVLPLSHLLFCAFSSFEPSTRTHFIPTGWSVADVVLGNALIDAAKLAAVGTCLGD